MVQMHPDDIEGNRWPPEAAKSLLERELAIREYVMNNPRKWDLDGENPNRIP